MHVTLEHHELTPHPHAEIDGCLKDEYHRTIKEVYPHLTFSYTQPVHLKLAANI